MPLKMPLFYIRIVIILLGLIGIYNLFKINKTLKYDRHFKKFAFDSELESENSLFDYLYSNMWYVIKTLSKFLNKIKILESNSKSFQKYIADEDKDNIKAIDYISMKILITVISVLLYIIFVAINYFEFRILVLVLIGILGYFLLNIVEKIKYKRKTKTIEEDLYRAISIMNNAFKSGHNVLQAIFLVTNELNGDLRDEFKKIYNDLKYGISIEESFKRFYGRTKLDDIAYIATALSLVNKTGGNITKIFENIEINLINKRKIRNELKSATSASVFIYRFLIVIPLVFIGIILILNPSYFVPMVNNLFGLFLSFITALLYFFYIVIIRKVLQVRI